MPALPPARKTWQFSLRSALFALALAGVAMSLWIAYRQSKQNEQLRKAVARLRDELHEPNIDEGAEDKLHAVAVPQSDFLTWKWRLYVPKNRTFGISVSTNNLTNPNIPEAKYFRKLEPGQHSFSAALRKSSQNEWDWVFLTDDSRQTFGPSDEDVAWAEHHRQYSSDQAGEKQTESVEPGKPLVLLRYRVFPRQGEDPKLTEGKGILLWISESGSSL